MSDAPTTPRTAISSHCRADRHRVCALYKMRCRCDCHNRNKTPKKEVAEATTVQPEGDPAQPGACREHLEPVEVAGRRPEPLTGQSQGGPIQHLASGQHHQGSHGALVPPRTTGIRASWCLPCQTRDHGRCATATCTCPSPRCETSRPKDDPC